MLNNSRIFTQCLQLDKVIPLHSVQLIMVKIKAEEHSEMDPQGSIGIILKYQRWLTNYVLPTQQLPTPRSFAASEVQRII